jgi:hypothetical protein
VREFLDSRILRIRGAVTRRKAAFFGRLNALLGGLICGIGRLSVHFRVPLSAFLGGLGLCAVWGVCSYFIEFGLKLMSNQVKCGVE